MAGPFCQTLRQQLMRIDDPDACSYYDGSTGVTPFELDPGTCEPHAGNIFSISMWCGWECRNCHGRDGMTGTGAGSSRREGPDGWNYPLLMEVMGDGDGGGEGEGVRADRGRLGEAGADFGSSMRGVGWRDQQGQNWRDMESDNSWQISSA